MPSPLPDEIAIRHVIPADVQAFRELRLEALKNHPEAFGMDYEDVAAKPEDYWKNMLDIDPKENAIFLALRGGETIGMTGIHRSLSRKSMHSAYIWGVYVKPEWRGKHIAEGLVRACLDWVEKQGVAIVKLAAVTENIAAIRCYERCGFKTYGTEPRALCLDGAYYDEYQ